MNQSQANKIRKIVQDNYQAIANEFNQTRQQPLWPRLSQIIQKTPLQGHLLDVGCGNGRLLKELVNQPITDYTGLDMSDKLLAIAQQQYGQYWADINLNWQLGDLLEQPLQQRQFEVVCCIAMLHHIPSQAYRQQAIQQLTDWLKPGGYLIISVWDLWSQTKYWPNLLTSFLFNQPGQADWGDLFLNWGNQNQAGYRRYYYAFNKKQLRQLVESTSLKIKLIDNDRLNHYLIAQKLINN